MAWVRTGPPPACLPKEETPSCLDVFTVSSVQRKTGSAREGRGSFASINRVSHFRTQTPSASPVPLPSEEGTPCNVLLEVQAKIWA